MMETNDERKNRLQIVLNDLQNGNLVDDKEARGEFGIPYNINQQHSDAEGQKWRQENDNGGTLFERVKNDAMDIYRNMFGAEETALRDAKKLSDSLGVSEQFLVDNPAALERARQMNNEAIQWSFMSGEPFSARNIDTLYPEIAEMRKADPVGAAIALKNHPDLTDTRPFFEQLSNTVAHSGELFTDAFNSGSDLMKLTDAQLKAYNTGDVEASRPAVDEISQRLQEYQENQPKTGMERVFYDTVQQLTVLGTQGIRALKRASQGAAIGMATVSPFAAAAAPETLGVGGAAILIGGAVTGATQGMRTGLFEQFENQSAAARYWELMSRKENGKNQYSRGRALFDSTVVGIGSGAVEMGLLEVGYGPVKAAWGESAVKSILKNAAARKEILDAGKLALAKSAAAAGVKQWGRGAGSELIEEGAQQAIGDIADNIEYYANGRTGPWHTSKDIISNAVDAMVQAAPAAVGMGSLGAVGHIGGQYHQSRAIASMKVEDYRQEYQRNIERNVIEQLIANKETNKLFKKSPEVYRDIIRAQAEKAGVDTMYVDAQELARSPEGVAVLNDMIDRNIATQEAVDKAITNGTDLEIDTGVFAQLADNDVDQKTLMDATTMNKGGVHIAALRERGKRMEAIRQELKDLAGNKSDELSEEIIQEHFAAADNTAQEAARDVVYRNPYDLERSYKDAVKDTRKQYEDALNFGYYWTYEPAGVTVLTEDVEGHSDKQAGRVRVSENEPWYSDMWKEYGRKATKKEMLDVAYKNERAEIAAHAPEKLAEWEDTVRAAKQKYEDLLGMKGTFDKLSKSDYALRQTFDKEGAEVYARTLEQLQKGNKAVAGAAKENAYIYAKMAERWAQIRRDYGDTAYTAKDFAATHPIRIGTAENKKAAQFEQREFADKVKANESVIAKGKEYIQAALKGEETASTFTLWKLSDVEVKRIKEELGINLSGYTLELVANDIRHAQKRHGEIVQHAIDVLAMPDEVVVGNTSSQGYPSIRFIKYENDGTVTVVENIYTKEKKLKLKTMWKDAPAAVDAKSPDNTSEYNGGDASFRKDSIAKEGGKNKSKESGYAQRAWHGSPYEFNTFDFSRMKGAYDSSTGILHLFDAADQSTFIHEAAHMYLHEMETMAELDEAPEQLVADLHTIRDWASYAPEKMADYVGNAREKEFRGYAEALEAARKSGDTVAIKAAEERWIQERFARAFERYVAEGKAPTKELQSAFRKFKTWLVSIYRDLKNLGKEPPEDVKKVMDRMLATDDEIEAWAKIKELSAWDRKGFAGDLSGSEGEMIRKWTQQIKDTAKEKLMRQYMEDQKKQWKQDKERGLETERIAYQEQLCKEEPIYKVENLYNNMPEARKALLAKHGYRSEAEFKQALMDAGGTMEERTAAYMEEKKKLYEEAMPSSEDIRQMADEELNSTNGQAALTQLEAAAMRKRLNGYITECMKALREVDGVTGTDAQVAEKLREIIGMADPEKAGKGNLRKTILDKNTEIKELKKRLAETKEKGKETKKENEQTIKQLKDGLNDVIQGLNRARDMTQGSYMATLRLAREELESRTVNNATTWRHYESKAATSSRRADAHMSAGNFEEAVAEKMNAQKYYCLARAAKDNKDFVRRALSGESGTLDANGQEVYGIKGILKQISKADKPVRMGAHARYFIQHLAYNLEITGRDGRPPLDDAGNPTSLNWDVIYSDLSPDYAVDKDTAPRGDNIIAPWLRQLVDRKERQNYEELTMAQFRDINEAVRVMYKVGRRDYESLSIVDDGGEIVSIEKAAETLASTMERNENWNPEQDKNNRTRWQHYGEKVSDAILSLTKIEVILQNFGPEWTKYIYNPIDKASSKELGMREKAMREFAAIHNMYSTEEWRSIRNERVYTVGDVDKYTREQLIVMALHWGNKEGRQRVMDELNKNVRNEAQKANEATVEDIFRRNLKDKDLDFIEAVWKQLNQYWPQRNKVQERLYGVGLGRVRALPYTLNGRKVSGGYFPIVYDRELSNRTSEIMMDDIARTIMSGNATMSIGMGSTKHRVQHVRNQTLAKTLDVWPSAVNEAIHHICMREAITDVYKLISHPDVERAVHENYGIKTYETLKQWAKDCWKTDIQRQSALTKTLERMRRNTAFAVMGYRTSTAALNVLNVFPMMKEIGLINTMQALTKFGIGFYKGTATYQRNRQFVMERSPFMAERANTIDKDIQQHMNIVVDNNTSKIGAKATSIKNTLNRNAYLFIAETDLMLSMALWKWKHDESVRKQINAGKTDETVIADNARTEADKAVRTVLGSSMVKDQAEIQRENGLAAQLAPFYSYSSAVMNALINAGYQWKKGNKIEMVNTMLYWIVLQTIFETLYREITKGDDDPEKIMKKMGVRLASNIGQGIPVIRDLMEMMANYVLGLPHYDSNNVLAITLVEEIGKAGEAAISPKKDITDVGRSATRALNRYVGMSDTLTDGFWSLMKFSFIDTDGSIEELVNSVLFDRQYKTEKERRQQERKRRNERRTRR